MKITTTYCVIAITKHFFDKNTDNFPLLRPSLWKRTSKSGSGDKIIRTFENKETGNVVKVISSDTTIFNILEDKPKITNLKSFLKQSLEKVDNVFYDLHYEVFDDVVNWPQVDIDDELEPLDMENFEWLSINDDEIIIACGGDWQEPLTLTIKVINGKLTVTNSREGFANGMYYDTFLKNIS